MQSWFKSNIRGSVAVTYTRGKVPFEITAEIQELALIIHRGLADRAEV